MYFNLTVVGVVTALTKDSFSLSLCLARRIQGSISSCVCCGWDVYVKVSQPTFLFGLFVLNFLNPQTNPPQDYQKNIHKNTEN